MKFNEGNYETANELIKSILFMYCDIMKTGEITNDIDYGTFDEIEHVNSTLDKSIENYEIDIDLINIGSAIKMLCIIYELGDQFESIKEAYNSEYFIKIKKALAEGKFKHLPDIENFVNLKIHYSHIEVLPQRSSAGLKYQRRLKPPQQSA